MATKNAIGTGMPIEVPFGGTQNSTLTDTGVLIGNGVASVQITAPGITGQVLGGATGLDPKFFTLVAGTNMAITPNVGGSTITFDKSGGGGNPAANSAFFAYRSANGGSGTGGGGSFNASFDTTVFDLGGNFNGTSFVPGVNGVYMLGTTIQFVGPIDANKPRAYVSISSANEIRNIRFTRISNPSSGNWSVSLMGVYLVTNVGIAPAAARVTYSVTGSSSLNGTVLAGDPVDAITCFWGFRIL